MAQIVTSHGLTQTDFALLRLFLGVEEWITARLAQALPLAPSSISRTVAKLVDMGLVQRRRLLSDQKAAGLTLTEEGLALTLHRRVQAYDAIFYDGVGEEPKSRFRLRPFQGNGGSCRHGIGGPVLTALHTWVHRFFEHIQCRGERGCKVGTGRLQSPTHRSAIGMEVYMSQVIGCTK